MTPRGLPKPVQSSDSRLEVMQRAIPIENLYYLLCYSYDQLPERDLTNIDTENCPDSLNLLALALTRSIRSLAKKGLERQYLEKTEETPRLQGRVLVHESRRTLIDRQGRMLCTFDELSVDCPSNRILRGTCDLLVRAPGLSSQVRKEVRTARKMLLAVRPVRVTESMCARIRIHRNNRRYRMPIGICRLIIRAVSPNERTGRFEFYDPLMEEMPALFENFVRNFAKIHLPQFKVSAMNIPWDGEFDEDTKAFIPIMRTDVTLASKESKKILDCKFYKNALSSRYEREKVHSGHLYQLTAYLRNASIEPGWENVTGQLLYPAVQHHLDLSFKLNSFPIRVSSIDLDQNWEKIEEQLLEILV